MKMKKPNYINFPIMLLDNFLDEPASCFGNILDYGLYEHSLKLEGIGDDFERFDNITDEFDEPLFRFKRSAAFFGVTLGNLEKSFANGQLLYDSMDPTKPPKAGIKLSVYWDFYDNMRSKKMIDVMCLLSHLAFNSIIGGKSKWKKTNNFLRYSRMNGDRRTTPKTNWHPLIQKYHSEYYYSKINELLSLSWGLKYYGRYTKGFYISYKLSFEELVNIAEDRRLANRIKENEENRKRMIDEILRKRKKPGT